MIFRVIRIEIILLYIWKNIGSELCVFQVEVFWSVTPTITLHSFITQKTSTGMFNTVKTSNLVG